MMASQGVTKTTCVTFHIAQKHVTMTDTTEMDVDISKKQNKQRYPHSVDHQFNKS